MSKHYGISGVGSDVQFGKANGRLLYESGVFKFTLPDGSTLENLEVAEPILDDHAATKRYVDSVSSGLDPKTAAQVATTADPGGTYNASGGAGSSGQFTGMTDTVDGVTLEVGDRILVKDDATLTQNGIYVVVTVGTGSNGIWDRAPDHDGTPAGEVAGGNFVFIQEGTVNANSGWVLQGDGILTLNTDDIVFVKFSGATTIAGGIGLTLNGSDLDLDFNDGSMTATVAVAPADLLAFSDSSNSDAMQLRTFANMLNDLDIVNNLGSAGFAVQTAADSYTARTLTVNGAGNLDGLAVSNADGSSGNPVFGLDIAGLPVIGATVEPADSIILYDNSGVANVKQSLTNVLSDLNIPNNISANGLVTRTSAGSYASRVITASVTASQEGLVVVNGNGISGNPTVGLDIDGLTAAGGNAADTDELVLFDGTNNRKYTVAELAGAPVFGDATSISQGNTSVTVADSGAGSATIAVDATTVMTSVIGDTTFSHNVIVNEISALTNQPIPAFKISGQTSGTPSTGIGVAMEFETETSAGVPGNLEIGGRIDLVSTDITSTTEDFDFVFRTMAGGATAAERARITSTGGISGTTLTASSLTNNRVLIAGSAGLIEDDADFTFDGTVLTLTGNMDITGDLDVDNININGNTVSVTNTNGNLNLQPNGSGDVRLLDGAGNEIIEFLNGTSALNHISVTAGATGTAPAISTNTTGSETNVGLDILFKGTGVLNVTSGSGNYEDNISADDDIPNKKYVDDLVGTIPTGSIFTVKGTVDLTSASSQSIGTLPANADVLKTTLIITTPSDAATTVTVGDATNGASSYMLAVENDPETADTFVVENYVANGAAARTMQATVATAGTTGSAIAIVQYRTA